MWDLPLVSVSPTYGFIIYKTGISLFMADNVEEGFQGEEGASKLQKVSTVLWIKG